MIERFDRVLSMKREWIYAAIGTRTQLQVGDHEVVDYL